MSTFIDKLRQRWSDHNSLLCVGLDPDYSKLPQHLKSEDDPVFAFNRGIIDATTDLVCAYKPNIAFYSGQSAEASLLRTVDYIHEKYPDIPVVLDSKRGDIGNTARMYAREAFEIFKADAVTVSPYLGGDTLQPYSEYRECGVIVLVRTSNPGSGDLQDLEVNGEKLSHIVARKCVTDWNENGNICAVVGATYPEELGVIRKIVGDMPLLIPGIGAQGGGAQAVVQNGCDSRGQGMLINSSRGIIFASDGTDFAEQARLKALELRDSINAYR